MRLSDYISDNLEEILQEWESFAASIVPLESEITSNELRDHAKAMLQVIAEDLLRPQTPQEQEDKSKGYSKYGPADIVGGEHGSGRLQSNFTIEQLLSEYRALRASVLRLWSRDNKLTSGTDREDIIRFNEAIDQLLAASVSSFAEESRQALDAERTRRNESLAMLANSEERFHRALQPQNVGVIFFDTEGRITDANDAFLRAVTAARMRKPDGCAGMS